MSSEHILLFAVSTIGCPTFSFFTFLNGALEQPAPVTVAIRALDIVQRASLAQHGVLGRSMDGWILHFFHCFFPSRHSTAVSWNTINRCATI